MTPEALRTGPLADVAAWVEAQSGVPPTANGYDVRWTLDNLGVLERRGWFLEVWPAACALYIRRRGREVAVPLQPTQAATHFAEALLRAVALAWLQEQGGQDG